MRTTVILPPELMRAAKARSAERGESLKALLARALAAELAISPVSGRPASRVRLPLFGDPTATRIALSNRDLAAALAAEDTEASRAPVRRRRK